MGFAMASSEKLGTTRAHFLKLNNIERETQVPLDQTSVINPLLLLPCLIICSWSQIVGGINFKLFTIFKVCFQENNSILCMRGIVNQHTQVPIGCSFKLMMKSKISTKQAACSLQMISIRMINIQHAKLEHMVVSMVKPKWILQLCWKCF